MTAGHDTGFDLLVEAITDYAIYGLDPEGRIVSWNSAAERIKGYCREQILGLPFDRFFTPEDQSSGMPARILAEAREHGRFESEGWRVRRDGSRFWALATVHAIRDPTGQLTGYAKITRDMTERRDQHNALIESERRFRYLVEGVVDYAIYMLDVNGTITNWNKGAERIKGYGADDVIGRHFSLFYTPEDRRAGAPARALGEALTTGRTESEGWRVRKDGTRFWASAVIDAVHDDAGRHIGFAKVTRDISARKAAEEALAESERQFRMLVAGVVDYALFMLDPNGIVSSWNVGAEHIKGYTAEEIIGQHVSQFYTEADRAAGLPTRALRTAAEQGRYEAEAWRVRKDGQLFWASVVLDAIRDEDGRLVGFAKITRDITERRKAQLELAKAHERLGQAQKMEAIGQLTGGIAHDFNNLLMVVGGQAQLLRKVVGDDPKILRSLDAIQEATRRGQDLTRHLLSFARRQRLQPVSISLSERNAALKELLSAGLPSHVRLEVDVPEDIWPVTVDQGELELALLNLVVNAKDAMPGGGILTIEASNVSLEEGADAGLVGDFVAMSIRDTGEGIPSDIQARIFEPFFTTKDVDKGTGLGLSQVYGFVQQAGGGVTVSSELGRGTAFTLYLPRSDDQAAEAGSSEGVEAPAGSRVLIVEDNPEVAEVTAALFEQLGNRTLVVGNAAAALKALAEGLPDLLFTDLVMAGEMDGLELARRVRQMHPRLPILLSTGYSKAAEGLGDEFPILAKPYEIGELSRAVGAAIQAARPDNVVNLKPRKASIKV